MVGRSGERWSRISVLAARHDDDDDILLTEALELINNLYEYPGLKILFRIFLN